MRMRKPDLQGWVAIANMSVVALCAVAIMALIPDRQITRDTPEWKLTVLAACELTYLVFTQLPLGLVVEALLGTGIHFDTVFWWRTLVYVPANAYLWGYIAKRISQSSR